MDHYLSVDQVIKNYMRFDPPINPEREKRLQEYYRKTERSADPCWKTIVSKDYQIIDHCDIFVKAAKKGTVLALYSSIKKLGSATVQAKS